MAAALFTLAWLLRQSSLIDFISETILLGFKAGAGLSIAVTQIPHLLGIPGGGHNFIERVIAIASQFLQVNPVVATIGLANLALLWLGEKFLPNRPIALLVVILSTGFISVTNLASHVETVDRVLKVKRF